MNGRRRGSGPGGGQLSDRQPVTGRSLGTGVGVGASPDWPGGGDWDGGWLGSPPDWPPLQVALEMLTVSAPPVTSGTLSWMAVTLRPPPGRWTCLLSTTRTVPTPETGTARPLFGAASTASLRPARLALTRWDEPWPLLHA